MLHRLDVPRRGMVPEQGGAAPGVLQQPEGGGSPLVVLGQVEEHVWKPPVLIPSEEEGCEACGVGKAELLPGKRLSPRRERHSAQPRSATGVQRLALTPTANALAARLGARAP